MNKETEWWNRLQTAGGWRNLVASLLQQEGKVISDSLDIFIKRFYWQFREKKGITQDYKPWIVFRGLEKWEDEKGKLGSCHFSFRTTKIGNQKWVSSGQISIVISPKYLLNWKSIGMDKLFSSNPNIGSSYNYLPISFEDFKDTIAHELAHAYQYIVNEDEERSSCANSGKKDHHGNYLFPHLVNEHTQLTTEIKQMITNYTEFENWWKKGYKVVPLSPIDERNEFESLVNLLVYSPGLEELEKSYQEVKNHFLYTSQKKTRSEGNNKENLDNYYAERKNFLERQKQPVFLTSGDKNGIGDSQWVWFFLMIGVGVLLIGGLLLVFWEDPGKKKEG